MGSEPPIVVIGVGNARSGRPKHTARNIAATKEFVVNLVTEELGAVMNVSAADFPEGQNELGGGAARGGQRGVNGATGGGGEGGAGVRAAQGGAGGGE